LIAPSAIDAIAELHIAVRRASPAGSTPTAAAPAATAGSTSAGATTESSGASRSTKAASTGSSGSAIGGDSRAVSAAGGILGSAEWIPGQAAGTARTERSQSSRTANPGRIPGLRQDPLAQTPGYKKGFTGTACVRPAFTARRDLRVHRIIAILNEAKILESLIRRLPASRAILSILTRSPGASAIAREAAPARAAATRSAGGPGCCLRLIRA
jgi:hypothetical protein